MAKTVTVPTGKVRRPAKPPVEGERKNTITKEEAREFFGELDGIRGRKDAANASFMSQINDKYEKASNKFGIPLKVLKHQYKKHVADSKREENERNMASSERQDLELLRDMLGDDTPLGAYIGGKAEEAARAEEEEAGA